MFFLCVFLDPVNVVAQEGSTIKLAVSQPGSGGPYEEIAWYKGTRNSEGRIVLVHPDATEGRPFYFNDYCSGSSPCGMSNKARLNVTTGELIIYGAQLSDADYYYYRFYINGGSPNTGSKYVISLDVNGKIY